jgi:hypothetical protein
MSAHPHLISQPRARYTPNLTASPPQAVPPLVRVPYGAGGAVLVYEQHRGTSRPRRSGVVMPLSLARKPHLPAEGIMAVYDDLQQLFTLQAETLAVEFKGWLNLSTAEGRAPLAKAAIALANHGGGTIIMGMREAAGQPVGSRPRPAVLPRYTADAVNAAINKYADPHIHCDVVHLVHPETGHEHAFIIVPGGHTVPIMSAETCPARLCPNGATCGSRGRGARSHLTPKNGAPF